jgi:hypothetical protein
LGGPKFGESFTVALLVSSAMVPTPQMHRVQPVEQPHIRAGAVKGASPIAVTGVDRETRGVVT